MEGLRHVPSIRASLKEKSDVSGGDVLSRHGNHESCKTEADGAKDVPELTVSDRSDGIKITHLLLSSVGVPSVDHRDDNGESPWGSTHEKGRDIFEAESSSQSGLTVSFVYSRVEADSQRTH
jgi:hypothetical protein